MKLTLSQLFILLAVLLNAAIGIVNNFATARMPDWLQSHQRLPWLVLGVLVVILVVVSLLQSGKDEPLPSPLRVDLNIPERLKEKPKPPITHFGVQRLNRCLFRANIVGMDAILPNIF